MAENSKANVRIFLAVRNPRLQTGLANLIRQVVSEIAKRLLITLDVELTRKIARPEVQRPGLSLSGFMKKFVPSRFMILGNTETLYLEELPLEVQRERLEAILTEETPAAVTASEPLPVLCEVCVKRGIPLFKTELSEISSCCYFLDLELVGWFK